MAINELIDSRIDNPIRWGTVTATSPLAVKFVGETASQLVGQLNSYSPTLNDYVMLVKSKNTYMCIGKPGTFSGGGEGGDMYKATYDTNDDGKVNSADSADTVPDKAITLAKMADMATASFIGRLSAGSGVPQILSKANALSILNVTDGANNYVHPNHSGDVTSVADGAQTIAKTAITGKTEVAADATDYILISDTTDSGNLKKALFPAGGSGDMLKSVYDPTNINASAFNADNHISGTTNKVYTATEQTKLSGIAAGAEVNVNADWNSSSGDSQILNKPTLPSGAIVGTTDTQTLTNKRINKRVTTEASNAAPTPNIANCDMHTITALAADATFGEPTGTPTEGQPLIVRIKDNGTARALAWNAIYRAMGVALPTTTVLGKTLYLGFVYNNTDTKWDLIAKAQEA